MLKDFVSPFNATVVDLLQASGAQVIGKTNCDEFGMGSLNVDSVHGPVVNPFQLASLRAWRQRTTFGRWQLGRQRRGCRGWSVPIPAVPVRLPAAYCGVVGLKPSYGLFSRWGIVPYADSLDTVGILAKDVALTQKISSTFMIHRTQLRATFSRNKGPNQSRNIRVGVPQEYFPPNCLLQSLTRRKEHFEPKLQGVTIVPVSLTSTPYALSAYYVIASAEASSNMARYDGSSMALVFLHLPDPTSQRSLTCTLIPGQQRLAAKSRNASCWALFSVRRRIRQLLLQAQRVRQLVKDDFGQAFRDVDVLYIRLLLGSPRFWTPPMMAWIRTCRMSNRACVFGGLPAISIPVRHEGWPVGVSVVGPWGADELVMKVGQLIESFNEIGAYRVRTNTVFRGAYLQRRSGHALPMLLVAWDSSQAVVFGASPKAIFATSWVALIFAFHLTRPGFFCKPVGFLDQDYCLPPYSAVSDQRFPHLIGLVQDFGHLQGYSQIQPLCAVLAAMTSGVFVARVHLMSDFRWL
ncbi:amidase signature domain-containing protein [Mucidula mucida]|nr:amidase signature domain-containing protein [Mucidula mucida]